MSMLVKDDPATEACTFIVDEIGRRLNDFVHEGPMRIADNATLVEANDIVVRVFREALTARPWITNRQDYAARCSYSDKGTLKLWLSPYMERIMAAAINTAAGTTTKPEVTQ